MAHHNVLPVMSFYALHARVLQLMLSEGSAALYGQHFESEQAHVLSLGMLCSNALLCCLQAMPYAESAGITVK
jgi:hypothetical protein